MQHRVAANSITIAFILDLNQLLSHAFMHACPDDSTDLGGVFRGRSGCGTQCAYSDHWGGFPVFVVRHCWHKSAQIASKLGVCFCRQKALPSTNFTNLYISRIANWEMNRKMEMVVKISPLDY